MPADPNILIREIEALSLSCPVGRVVSAGAGTVRIAGLAQSASVGDRLTLERQSGGPLGGEVLRVDPDLVTMLPDTAADGVAAGNPVMLRGTPEFAPADTWVGRVVDPYGRPLDGKPMQRGPRRRPPRRPRPVPASPCSSRSTTTRRA